jgi:hypothetical protein
MAMGPDDPGPGDHGGRPVTGPTPGRRRRSPPARSARPLAIGAVLGGLLLAGCGTAARTADSPTQSTDATTTGATTSTTGSTTGSTGSATSATSPASGPATSDVASASGTGAGSAVTLSSRGPAVAVTSTVPVPHGSQVTATGSATADLTFARTSACALQPTDGGPGRLTTRVPPTALLQLTQGVVICTIPAVAAQIQLCGSGVVYANGTAQAGAQFVVTCDPDPLFSVAVLDGSVQVVDPSGEHTDVGGGEQMSCNPKDCQAVTGGAGFTDDQLAVFSAQSNELHWFPPTTSTATSTPTTVPPSTTTTVAPTTAPTVQ